MMSRKRRSKTSPNNSNGRQKILSISPLVKSSMSKEYSTDEADTEVMLSCLGNFVENIVTFYCITWQRDCELGYPGYRRALAKPELSIEESVNLREEEITRLNTILPKLEELYMKKLRDCWSSLVFKLRQMSKRNPQNFKRLVTNIHVRILTHKMHSDSCDFHCST